jgi:Tol biopolymer transport system component/flagellar hook assembly protein FlgD/subtilase family serine protease/fibronectin type 3 domain-containing protein
MCSGSSLFINLSLRIAAVVAIISIFLLSSAPSSRAAFTARQIGDYCNVTVMEVAGNYDARTPDGQVNALPRQAIAKEFFRTHKDEYDFIVIFTNFSFAMPEEETQGFYTGVKNDVRGIGREIFDNTFLYGSNNRLQGTIDMGNVSSKVSDPIDPRFEETLGVLSHEMLHRWGSYVKFRDPSGNTSSALLGKDNAHWSYLLDSKGSLQYGNHWQDNGNGAYTSIAVRKYYSPLDLYLMGMIDSNRVPPMLLIDNPAIDPVKLPELGATVSGSPKTVTIGDIIAFEGERIPAAASSQKQFKIAFILATGPGSFTGQELPGIENIRNGFLTRYSILTDGKGLVQVISTPRDDIPVNPGRPPVPVVPRTLPSDIRDGVRWLTEHQQPDGSWSDQAITSERDTAEAVAALNTFPTASQQFETGLQWLASTSYANTDYLARRLESVVRAGGDAAAHVNELAALQNPDGGWGSARSFISGATDTALALRALVRGGYADRASIGRAVDFLKAQPKSDGGWSDGGPTSAVLPTAAAVSAIVPLKNAFNLAGPLERGISWLLSRQNSDGGFGNSPSTAYDTSLAVMALREAGASMEATNRGVDYIQSQQSEKGSWFDSPFQTALAVRAVWEATVDPDLSVTNSDISFIPARITSLPTTAVVNSVISNLGRTDVPQARIVLYDGTITPDNKVGEQTAAFPALSPVNITFAVPVNDGREHTFHIVADPDNQVKESSETNNSALKTLLPEVSYDFQVLPGDITVSGNPAEFHQDMRIGAKVVNKGTSDAFNVQIQFFIDEGGAPFEIATLTADIPAGGAVTKEITWKTDKAGTAMPLTVQADPFNTFTEISEDNNRASVPITVNGSTLSNISLSHKDIVITPTPAREQGAANISILVKNNGFAPAENVKVDFYKGVPGKGGEVIGSSIIPALAAGQSETVAISWGPITDSGERVIYVVADPQGVIQEVAEDDNEAFTTLEILSLPDLAITASSITLEPNAPREGDPLQISLTVQNLGDQDALNVPVELKENGSVIGSLTIPVVTGKGQAVASIPYPTAGKSGSHGVEVAVDPASTLMERSRDNNRAVKTFSIQNTNLWVSEPFFSPNGDGVKDTTDFFFRLADAAKVTVLAVNRKGETVRTFAGGELDNTSGTTVTWDGKGDGGMVVADGDYQLKVVNGSGTVLGSLPVVVDNNRSSLAEAFGTNYFYKKEIGCNSGFHGVEWQWLNDESGFVVNSEYAANNSAIAKILIASEEGEQQNLLEQSTGGISRYGSFSQAPAGEIFSFISGFGWLYQWRYQYVLKLATRDNLLASISLGVDSTCYDSLGSLQQKWSSTEKSLAISIYAVPSGSSSCATRLDLVDWSSLPASSKTLGYISTYNWSPDGSRLAYVVGGIQVRITDSHGNTPVNVYTSTHGYITTLQWLDDNKLMLASYGYGTFIVDINNNTERRISEYASPSLAPDKSKILIQTEYGGDIISLDGSLLNRFSLLLSETYFVREWSLDSRYVAIQLYKNHDHPINILDTINNNLLTLPCETQYPYPPVHWYSKDVLVYATAEQGVKAYIVSVDKTYTLHTFDPFDYYEWNDLDHSLSVSPFGSYLSWNDPDNYDCFSDSYYISFSLLNLLANLSMVTNRDSIVIKGTAVDLNFGGWRLEYADSSAPDTWSQIVPASEAPVIDATFATWVPPAEGIYNVRLTAWDKAGNTAAQFGRVSWKSGGGGSSITNVYKSLEIFSPNGNGVNDSVELHFQALEPVHLEFSILNENGDVIRSFTKDKAEPGQDFVSWDGKDDSGRIVSDGKYSIKVFNYEFHVEVDNTLPVVGITIGNLVKDSDTGFKVGLVGHAMDKNFKKWAVLKGEGENPLEWSVLMQDITPLYELNTKGEAIDKSISDFVVGISKSGNKYSIAYNYIEPLVSTLRIDGEDFAGNRRTVRSNLLEEKIALLLWDANLIATSRSIPAILMRPSLHRVEALETVRNPFMKLNLQYALYDIRTHTETWHDDPAPVSTSSGILATDWNNATIGGNISAIRMRGIDTNGKEYLSERYPVEGEFGVSCDVKAVNSLYSQLTRLEFQLQSNDDSRYKNWTTVSLSDTTKGDTVPEGKFDFPIQPGQALEGKHYNMRMAGNDLQGALYYSNQTTMGCEPPDSLVLDLSITFPAGDCGAIQQKAETAIKKVEIIGGEKVYYPLSKTNIPGLPVKLDYHMEKPDGSQVLRHFDLAKEEIQGITIDTTSLAEGKYTVKALLAYIDITDGTEKKIEAMKTLIVDRIPPEARITYPADSQLTLCPVQLNNAEGPWFAIPPEGVAQDNNGVGKYELFYGTGDAPGTWKDANTRVTVSNEQNSSIPISGKGKLQGTIGNWDIKGLSDRDSYVLKLKVTDVAGNVSCGASASFRFDNAIEIPVLTLDKILFSPNGDGTLDNSNITYRIDEYVEVDVRAYKLILASNTPPVLDSTPIRSIISGQTHLSGTENTTWYGTSDTGVTVQDGSYGIAVFAKDSCGNTNRRWEPVNVDNTPPFAEIAYPRPIDILPAGNIIEIKGSADDANFNGYTLEAGEGAAPQNWAVIASGGKALNSILGRWNTFGKEGEWTLRLSALDNAGNKTSVTSAINLGQRMTLVKEITATPLLISPNNDFRIDETTIGYELTDACIVTIELLNDAGNVVKAFPNITQSSGIYSALWDGKSASGGFVPDGNYSVRLTAQSASVPTINQTETITLTVDTTPPLIDIKKPVVDNFVNANEMVVNGSISDPNFSSYSLRVSGPDGTSILSEGAEGRENYSFGTISALKEERYSISIEAKDQGENQSLLTRNFTVDRTPPKVTLDTPKGGEYYGDAKNVIDLTGSIVERNIARYSLRFSASESPTEWQEIIGGDTVPITAKLYPWKVGKDDGIADGIYTVSLYAKDKAGLKGEAKATVTIDNTLPDVSLTLPKEGDYVKDPFDIKGTMADANLDKGLVEISEGKCPDAFKWTTVKTVNTPVQNGVIQSFQLLPADGDYCLKLSAVDRVGNRSETKVSFTIDSKPPAAPQLSGKIENRTDVRLDWTRNSETDFAGYNIYRDGAKLNSALVDAIAYNDSVLKEGGYSYIVKAVDRAGNESVSSSPVRLTMDVTGPSVRIASPMDGSRVGSLLDIKGTAYSADDFKQYRVSIGKGVVPASWSVIRTSPAPVSYGTFAIWDTIAQTDGDLYVIKLDAEDLSGNTSTCQVVVTIDNSPPAVPVLLTAVRSGANVALTWQKNNETDLAGYLLYRNDQLANVSGNVIGNLKLYLLTGLSYTNTTLPDGSHTYYLVAMDQAGNTSGQSNSLTVELDNRRPHAVITKPASGTKLETRTHFKAESPDSDIVSVQFHYKKPQDSSWTNLGVPLTSSPYMAWFDPQALGLAYGDYQIMATAKDKVGTDPSPTAITVTYTDLTTPAVPAGLKALTKGNNVTLTWSANSETDLDGYNIYRTEDSNKTKVNSSLLKGSANYIDSNISDGDYVYNITAVDTFGNESLPSETATARVYSPSISQPYTPTGENVLRIEGHGAAVNSTVQVFLENVNGRSSNAQINSDAQGIFALEEISLALGENRISVKATDTDGNISKESATVVIAYNDTPSAPTNLGVVVSGYAADINWYAANTDPEVIGYNIYRDGAVLNPSGVVSNGTASGLPGWSSNPSYAVDGKQSTYWSCYAQSSNKCWWEYDFQQPELINHLDIRWGTAQISGSAILYGAKDFEVQVWSGYAWIPLSKVTGNDKKDSSFDVKPSYRTDRIRIYMTSSLSTYIWISEISLKKDNLVYTNSYQDAGLKDGIYNYKVTAVDRYGFESEPSNEKKAAVGDVTPPTTPQNLTASGTRSEVVLDWSLTPNTESDLAGYRIYRQKEGIWVPIADVVTPSTTYLDASRPNGTYSYHITARDLVGNESPPSTDVSVTIAVAPPPVPPGLTITAPSEGKSLQASWQAAGGSAYAYRIYRSDNMGGPYQRVTSNPVQSLTFLDQGLKNGTRYYYVVNALDAQGNEGNYSTEASGVPFDLTPPELPMILAPTLPVKSLTVYQDKVAISGTVEPGSTVKLTRGEDYTGITIALAEDSHITKAMDVVGSGKVVSPGGGILAYVDSNGALTLKDLTNGTLTIIAVSGKDAVWSPDGRKIAFSVIDSSGNPRIRLYDLDAAKSSSLTDDSNVKESLPSWSGDGTRIVFRSNRGGTYDIWIKNFVDHSLVKINGNVSVSKLSISPDASRTAYFYYNYLYVINNLGGAASQLDNNTDQSSITWSPDSRKVAFISYRDGKAGMYITDLTSMTTSKVLDYPGSAFSQPAWSPDGTKIIYSQSEINGSSLRTIGLDGKQETLLDKIGSVNPLRWAQSGEITFIEGNNAHLMKLKGTFSLSNVKLTAGENLIHAVAIDESGNSSLPSDPVTIIFDTGLLPDPAVTQSDISIVPMYPKPGEDVLVQAVVKNPSSNDVNNVTVELHLWDSAGILTLLKSEVIPLIASGSVVTVSTRITAGNVPGANTVIVVADPADTIGELSETNNYATAEFYIAENDGAIMTTTLSSPQYASDQDVHVALELRNSGADVNGNLEVAVEDQNGARVRLLDKLNVTLTYGQKKNLSYIWNTGSTFAGNYRVHSFFTGAMGIISENKTPFAIAPVIKLDMKAVTDRVIYGPKENVTLSVTARNNGKNYIIPKIEVRSKIKDPLGSEVFSDSKEILNLFPETEATIKPVWSTGVVPPGDYHIKVDLYLGGNSVAAKELNITVKPVSVVTGSIIVEPAVASLGETFKALFTVSNSGNSAFDGTIRVSLIDPESQAIMSSLEQPVSLPLNGTRSGDFYFNTVGLSMKTYTVRLQYVNGDTVKAISDSPVTIKDGIPPVVTILSPGEGKEYNGAILTLALVHDDASVVQKVEYRLDSGEWRLLPVSDPSNGKYSITWDPAASDSGNHTVSIRAVDGAGNISTPGSVSFNVKLDTTPPVLMVSTLSDGAVTKQEALNISGTVTDDTAVRELLINGEYVPINPDGSFSHVVLLTDGGNRITTTASDFAGNHSEDVRTITLDRNAPSLDITSPIDNLRTGDPMAVVSGTVNEQCTVEIVLNGTLLTTLTIDREFVYTVALQTGINNIEVITRDPAGNPSTQKRTVFSDNEKPTLAITNPAQDIRTNVSNIVIQGVVSDQQSPVSLKLNVDGTIYTPTVVNGAFEQAITLVEEKLYSIVATASDGIEGHEVIAQRNIIYDVTKPVLTIDPVTSPTEETSQVVTGTREEGLSVTVSCPTATVDEISYPTITTWRTVLTDLNTGDNIVSVSSSDMAGNRSDVTSKIVVQSNESDLILIPFPNILWPPNHRMVLVLIAGWVSHPCHTDITSVEISVTDEYGQYNYDHLHFGSIVRLEAWRKGNDKDGRVYTVTAVATHKDGRKTFAVKRVVVPHDMSPDHGGECGGW